MFLRDLGVFDCLLRRVGFLGMNAGFARWAAGGVLRAGLG